VIREVITKWTIAAFGTSQFGYQNDMIGCKEFSVGNGNEHLKIIHRHADKSLARSGRKQARKHARDARDFNNIETPAVIRFLFLQGKAPKEIHAILAEILACFLPGRAKDLSAPLSIAETSCISDIPHVQTVVTVKDDISVINQLL